jgi:hypothetical protein
MMALVLAAAITLVIAVSVALIASDDQVAAPSAAAPGDTESASFQDLPPGGSAEDKARWGMH